MGWGRGWKASGSLKWRGRSVDSRRRHAAGFCGIRRLVLETEEAVSAWLFGHPRRLVRVCVDTPGGAQVRASVAGYRSINPSAEVFEAADRTPMSMVWRQQHGD